MQKLLIILLTTILLYGCSSLGKKKVNDDLTGINEQLYDLEKKSVRLQNENSSLRKQITQIQQERAKEKLDNNPDFDRVYKRAYALMLDGKYEDAAGLFAGLTKDFKLNTLSDNALYWHGKSELKMGNEDKALLLFQITATFFPFGDKADQALFEIGEIFLKKKNYPKARLAFNKVVLEYPDSLVRKKSRSKLNYIKRKYRRSR